MSKLIIALFASAIVGLFALTSASAHGGGGVGTLPGGSIGYYDAYGHCCLICRREIAHHGHVRRARVCG
jgi:hypothetical protein